MYGQLYCYNHPFFKVYSKMDFLFYEKAILRPSEMVKPSILTVSSISFGVTNIPFK